MTGAREAAAVLTVGTELTCGLQLDTNAPEIAAILTAAGFDVAETISVADDVGAIRAALERLIAAAGLVVVTGGLGPTHDDVTREAAAEALGAPLERDPAIAEGLRPVMSRHHDPEAAAHVLLQADVLRGARVLPAVVGTAPGQILPTARGHLVLLPGPPREMRPLLDEALRALGVSGTAHPLVIGTTGLSESDIQLTAERVIAGARGIGFTVLARPGEVRVVLIDRGAGAPVLAETAAAICDALGDACFSPEGLTLAASVLQHAREASCTIATAESCTGGMIAAALTDVPGASDVFLGGIVAYGNGVKIGTLGVGRQTIEAHGAVSRETALQMASGAKRVTGADWSVSTTGIAGPGGGSEEKPVGTVWFAVDGPSGAIAVCRRFPGDREAVRVRATAAALDLLRLAVVGINP